MKVHILIPNLFWSDKQQPEIYQSLPVTRLSQLLSKSDCTVQPAEELESWLCKRFNIIMQQNNWPVAPVMLHADAPGLLKSDKDFWMRADPVHLRIEQNHIMLADSQAFQISGQEAEEITRSLNDSLGDPGFSFMPLHPNRWYIRTAQAPEMQTCTLSQVTCRNINHYLPTGSDSIRWHKIFNEIQMLLYDHPVNQSRESRGELTVNSVWFWGGGVMPQAILSPYTHIWSNNDLASALAIASHTGHSALPENTREWLYTHSSGNHFIVLDALRSKAQYRNAYDWRETLASMEQHWFTPIYDALKQRSIKELVITTFNEASLWNFVIKPADLWKFWRLNQPLNIHSSKH